MRVLLHKNEQKNLHSTIQITGSKSESNRLLVLQAQFPNLKLQNVSNSDDTAFLKNGLVTEESIVDIHHAGTAMRFLTAFFAFQEGKSKILTGSARMHQRPIGILVEALRDLGANISYLEKEGFPPLNIEGSSVTMDSVQIDAQVSSQYISALILVAPSLTNGLSISLQGAVTSKPYIQMTLSLLDKIGVKWNFLNNKIEIEPQKEIVDQTIQIESDWSSASYFYSIVALSENLSITLSTFYQDSLQGDSEVVNIYKVLGVTTRFDAKAGAIHLSKSEIIARNPLELNLADTPDIAQTIAVTCFGLGLGCTLGGLHTLPIKETDRLLALRTELEKLGASVSIKNNSLKLAAAFRINQNITIDTYNDHRMAMAFAPLGYKTPILINDSEVVSKSFPSFWECLQKTGILVSRQ